MKLFRGGLNQDFNFKFIFLLGWLVLFLGMFSAARYAVFHHYHPVFAALSPADIWGGFLQGVRFDLATTALFSAVPVLVLQLPVKSEKFIKIVHFCWCVLFIVFAGILIGDFIYFSEAKRHLGEEVFAARNELGFLFRFALGKCWVVLLALSVGFILLWWAGNYGIRRFFRPRLTPWWKTVFVFILTAGLLFVGIRGHLGHGKALSLRSLNRFSSGGSQAILMTNGVFSLYHSVRKARSGALNPMPADEAWRAARQMLASPKETWLSGQYPLSRRVAVPQGGKVKNVFVVLLESWTPKYIDSFNSSAKHYAVTPHFDKMAREGIRFTQAFSTGVRSIFGLTASFGGIALVPGIAQFSDGLELNYFTGLAHLLRRRGYYTAFLQSSQRSSYQMCRMATNIFGFEDSFGMEDMPHLMDYTAKQDFGYDYDLLNFAADKASSAAEKGTPFFIFAFTGTTHIPFNPTTEEFDKYPRTSQENNYLNTLFYADYSIGALLEKAERGGWLADTAFIFMADHTAGFSQVDDELYAKFRIPLVVYIPGGGEAFAAREINYPVSQLDLMPTLFHLLGLEEPFSALGNDMLDASAPHFAFISEGTNLALITEEGFIRHDRVRVLEHSAKEDSVLRERLARQLLALDKTVTSLIQTNKWAPPSDK